MSDQYPDRELFLQTLLDHPNEQDTTDTVAELTIELTDHYADTATDPKTTAFEIARAKRQVGAGALLNIVGQDMLVAAADTYFEHGTLVRPEARALDGVRMYGGESYDPKTDFYTMNPELPPGSFHDFCMIFGSWALGAAERLRLGIASGESPYQPLWQAVGDMRKEWEHSYREWKAGPGKGKLPDFTLGPTPPDPGAELQAIIRSNIEPQFAALLADRMIAGYNEGVHRTPDQIAADATRDMRRFTDAATGRLKMAMALLSKSPFEQYRQWLALAPEERPKSAYDTSKLPMAFPSGGCPHKAFAKGEWESGGLCFARLRSKPFETARPAVNAWFSEFGWRGLNPNKFNYIETGLVLGNAIARDTFYQDMPGLPRPNERSGTN